MAWSGGLGPGAPGTAPSMLRLVAPRTRHLLAHALDPVERWSGLDGGVRVLQRAAAPLGARRGVRNLLSGVPQGHPTHPALAQLTVGCFLSAGLLDLRGRAEDGDASTALIAAGVASAVPTALAGLSDWSYGHPQQQRTGLVHALANSTALLLYVAALAQRARGGRGRTAALAGLAVASGGAYLGGHLAFRQSLGPNHAEQVQHRVPPGWQELCPLHALPVRQATVRRLDDEPVMAYRDGDTVHVVSDVCPHLSGPLHEGTVDAGSVTCPWHGSRFSLDSGDPEAGPATAPVPVFDVRIVDGVVHVRLPDAG